MGFRIVIELFAVMGIMCPLECCNACKSSLAEWSQIGLQRGIQGVFGGNSRGIRVQKREFRPSELLRVLKNRRFLHIRVHAHAPEFLLYNIKGETRPARWLGWVAGEHGRRGGEGGLQPMLVEWF